MPSLTRVQTLLFADFEAGFSPFTENDFGDDVARVSVGSSTAVQIDDNTDSNITSGQIDTSSVDPRNMLVVAWDWRTTPGNTMHDVNDYVLVEY